MKTSEPDCNNHVSAFVSVASRRGWQVTASGNWGLQLCRPKIYNKSFLWSGALLLVLGIGILIWIWGYIDYLIRRDEVLFVSMESLLNKDMGRELSKL